MKLLQFGVGLCSMLANVADSQTYAETLAYPAFTQIAERWRMTWETYPITSLNGDWTIPVFHIKGSTADGVFPYDPEKSPLLFMHGAFGDAAGWLSSSESTGNEPI